MMTKNLPSSGSRMREQLALDLPLPERRESGGLLAQAYIIAAEANRVALRWIERWPDWPAPALILAGSHGSGKSSLAHMWADSHGIAPETISGQALSLGSSIAQKIGAHRAEGEPLCLVIDKADEIPGDRLREEALFHLYNQARDSRGSLLMLAERPPAYWSLTLPDLRSRLLAAPMARIEEPDEALAQALIRRHFALRQLHVADETVASIAALAERSYGGIAEAVRRLDEAALRERKTLTPAFAKRLLLAED